MFLSFFMRTHCSDHVQGVPKSILDRDKTAQAVLDMAGKTRHSEGLREPEETN